MAKAFRPKVPQAFQAGICDPFPVLLRCCSVVVSGRSVTVLMVSVKETQRLNQVLLVPPEDCRRKYGTSPENRIAKEGIQVHHFCHLDRLGKTLKVKYLDLFKSKRIISS